jgi:outer membrane protein
MSIYSVNPKNRIAPTVFPFFLADFFYNKDKIGTRPCLEAFMNSSRIGLAFFSIVLFCRTGPQSPAWAEEQGKAVAELTLTAFVQEVVRLNPAVQEARLQYLISRKEARAEWGTFEPELVGRYDRNKLERENTTVQASEQLFNPDRYYWEENEEYGLGLEGKFFSGGSYRIGYSLKKMDNKLIKEGEEYESFFGVSGEQPLLRGLTHGAPMAGVRAAMQDRFIAFHSYRRQLMETISQAESAYWNLSFAQEAYHMSTDSVEIAKKIVEDNRERVRAGKMTELDLMEAEAELAIRIAQQASARQDLLDATTQVKLLLSDLELGEDQQFTAVDPLAPSSLEDWSREEQRQFSVKWALRAQPDYMMRWEELQREMIVWGYQKDQQLPDLNLKASYGLRGLSDSFEESLDKVGTLDFPSWSLGVEMRIPLLGGVREKNNLEASSMKRKLAELRLAATKYEIVNSIETLIQRVATLRQRIQNAQKVVEFRKRLLDVELSRLEAGKSTPRLVYQAEDQLSEARRWELESLVQFREAFVQLAYFRGSVLLDKGLESTVGEQVVLDDHLIYGWE